MSTPREILASIIRSVDGSFFKPIDFGDFSVSAQGSDFHYCSPRINLKNLIEYDSVEIAVFRMVDGEKCFVNIRNDKLFKDFVWADKFEDQSHPVAPYISMTDVEKIITDVMIVSNRMKN